MLHPIGTDPAVAEMYLAVLDAAGMQHAIPIKPAKHSIHAHHLCVCCWWKLCLQQAQGSICMDNVKIMLVARSTATLQSITGLDQP